MTILVTGAAGFIGSNLTRYLLDQGLKVLGLDAYKAGSSKDNTIPLREDSNFDCVHYELGSSLSDSDRLSKILELYDVTKIVHLAAESHVDRSIEGNKPFWQTQVMGTQELLEEAHKYGKIKCFINQITDEAYGEVPEGVEAPKEGSTFNPNPFYAASKVAQYYVGKSYWKTHGFPVISTFPVNNYGPRQWPEKLIPKFVTRLLAGEKVPLMKSTHFQRDWLPVIDMAGALALLLKKGEPGEDYNVGADNHHTNLEITHKILALLGKDENSIEIIPDRATHDCRYAVDSTKLKKLGWELSKDFDEYLEYTVGWYEEQQAYKEVINGNK